VDKGATMNKPDDSAVIPLLFAFNSALNAAKLKNILNKNY
jgi:hypothetical protein